MPKCRLKGCQAAVDPGFDLCFAHRLERDATWETEQAEKAEQIERDFRETFADETGQRVLAYLASAFFLGDSTLIINKGGGNITGVDPLHTVFNEGTRFVVLRILTLAGRLGLKDIEVLTKNQEAGIKDRGPGIREKPKTKNQKPKTKN